MGFVRLVQLESTPPSFAFGMEGRCQRGTFIGRDWEFSNNVRLGFYTVRLHSGVFLVVREAGFSYREAVLLGHYKKIVFPAMFHFCFG